MCTYDSLLRMREASLWALILVEEANTNAGVNVSQWDEEAMPQNTNKLVHLLTNQLAPCFSHTHRPTIL